MGIQLPEGWHSWPPAMKKQLLDEIKRRADAFPDVAGSKYELFKKRFYHDPAGFARECIRWPRGGSLTPYQEECCHLVLEHDRVSVRGPHSLGKSCLASIILLWFALTRDGDGDWKVPTLASVWRQLAKFLWPEIHKWARRLRWDEIGRKPFNTRTELMKLSLTLSTGEAFALTSDNPEDIEGAHADHLLYILDESKAIAPGIWDAAEGALAGGKGGSAQRPTETKALAISTPGEPEGRFYEIHRRKPGTEDWHVRHVTIEEAIAAGRISQDWVEQRKRQWGESSAVFRNRVLGEFAEQNEEGVIPLRWLELANERWLEWQDAGFSGNLTSVGVDVGSGGETGDLGVIAPVYDLLKVGRLRFNRRSDPNLWTMEIAGTAVATLGSYETLCIVDVNGVGAGVTHRLREMRYNVFGFNGAFKTDLRDVSGELGFVNWRSAAYYLLREILDPMNSLQVAIPPDNPDEEGENITGDLTSATWQINSSGRIQVEPKAALRKKLRRSPDCGDAVMMALIGPVLIREYMAREGFGGQLVYLPEVIGDY